LKRKLGGTLTRGDFEGIPETTIETRLLSYPWDLVRANGEEIRSDVELLRNRRKSPIPAASFRKKGVTFIGEKNIFIGRGSTIGPGTVIDASGGPVILGEGVRVYPQATMIGPVFVGNGSVVKVGAQLYPDTSIGPVCKVGGEVEGTIIHGYSNKQHHGFIGHSYIGAWANLGAGTTNSDLKNNYGKVRVRMDSGLIDTGLQFVGLTLGDHSKTAINSMFNTGTIVGVCSNIFGFGFPPKEVPSFSWGAAGETFTTFALDKAVDMARRVMARRNVTLTGVEDRLIRNIFEQSAGQRRRLGMPG
jgi:UDP-N-acetylglucosamine diphosphorylase/glucosamine-1-phosphate N-acetyltransferase